MVFNSSSFPLGLTDDLKIDEITVDMQPDSQFILCSDGALEPYKGGINEQFQLLLNDLANKQFTAPTHVNDDIAMLKIIHK